MKRTVLESFCIYLCFILSIFCLNNCSKDDNPASPSVSGNIVTGETVSLGSTNAGQSGSTFEIDKPGDPLDKMKIEIPDSAFTVPVTINLSYETIESHKLGPNINPVTPLIKIQCSKETSDKPLVLSVPVDVPDSVFVMLFAYDKVSGKIHALPYVHSDNKTVVAFISDFYSSSEPGSIFNLKNGSVQGLSDLFCFGSKIPLSKLTEPEIPTGFKPGVDDWQYVNMGSYVQPQGHCAGQCFSALWYFQNKKSSLGNLYGKFDNSSGDEKTPGIWVDDVLGYRLASAVQEEDKYVTHNTDYASKVYSRFFSKEQNDFRAICYAILATNNQPQILAVYGNSGSPTRKVGHAVICYGKNINSLLVADPNYPGNRNRLINMFNGQWETYYSGPIGSIEGIPFKEIHLLGTPSSRTVSKYWNKFENKTIGDGDYPTFMIKALNDEAEFVELKNGFKKDNGSFSLVFSNVTKNSSLLVDSLFIIKDTKLSRAKVTDNRFNLESGKQKIGLYIIDSQTGRYVDFKWYEVEISGGITTFNCTGTSNLLTNIRLDGVPIGNRFDPQVFSLKYDPEKKRLDIKHEMSGNDEYISFFFEFEPKPGQYDYHNTDQELYFTWDAMYRNFDSTYSGTYKTITKMATVNVFELDDKVISGNLNIKMTEYYDPNFLHTFTADFYCSH